MNSARLVVPQSDVGYDLGATDIIVTQHEVVQIDIGVNERGQRFKSLVATVSTQAKTASEFCKDPLMVVGNIDFAKAYVREKVGATTVKFQSPLVDGADPAVIHAVGQLLENKHILPRVPF